ncbi:MAG: rnhA operon protein [Halobaculum sp.]
MTDSDSPERSVTESDAAVDAGTDGEEVGDSRASGDGTDPDGDEVETGELPHQLVEETRRLTRLARRVGDEQEADAYREGRDERLADHGFTSRLRADDDTLVLYPEEWIEDGTVQFERVEDTDRAYELTLSGPGDPDEWERVEEHNAELVAAVGEAYGEIHRRNARVFADFMGNHYARRVETATPEEVTEFLEDYYRRNAWLSADARESVEASIRHVFDVADVGGDPPV